MDGGYIIKQSMFLGLRDCCVPGEPEAQVAVQELPKVLNTAIILPPAYVPASEVPVVAPGPPTVPPCKIYSCSPASPKENKP